MIVYFSGTGNSRYCAQWLAERLQDEAVDSFPYLRGRTPAALASQKPWVFVSPTYAWRLPRIFEAMIRGGRFSGSRDAWFVMTCGSETGSPEPYIQALCAEKGLTFRGVLPVVMPENYIAMFNAPREDEARQIIAAAHPALERGAACIREGRDFPVHPAGIADRLKSGPVNPMFYWVFVKSQKFRVTGACTGCGKCARACPLSGIRMESGRPVWTGGCTHCMACICGCPAQAVEYGTASLGKPRYQCPAYSGGANHSV